MSKIVKTPAKNLAKDDIIRLTFMGGAEDCVITRVDHLPDGKVFWEADTTGGVIEDTCEAERTVRVVYDD